MKKIKDREKHLKRFIGLAIIFFSLELLLQLFVILSGWNITIGGVTVSLFVSYNAAFISAAMIVMGVYYLIYFKH